MITTSPLCRAGSYDIIVTAAGFKKYQAKGVKLDVAEKARVDVTSKSAPLSTEVIVEGANVAQVETQSSDLSGTVTRKGNHPARTERPQLHPVGHAGPWRQQSDRTGRRHGRRLRQRRFSINGGRTEYNNWELDGGDNMDNGSNSTLNVYPSIDAIAEFKVLTSNYGAQYGRNGSGTVEVETKSGTNHSTAMSTNSSATTLLTPTTSQVSKRHVVPEYKKNDFGYTIGGPGLYPRVYNKNKQKTFFFWSQEWRKECVPGQVSM